MKYAPRDYAEAFAEAYQEVSAAERAGLLHRFAKTIQRHGDLHRVPKIFTAIEEQFAKQRGGRMVKVEFAREVADSLKKKVRERFLEKDIVVFAVNPKLIAGVRITINGEEELDNSFQRKLLKMFS